VKLDEELLNCGSGFFAVPQRIRSLGKNHLPNHRQKDGRVLLRNERRQVVLQVHEEDLRPVLLRHEIAIGDKRSRSYGMWKPGQSAAAAD
jgi:hypothetical protein